jgi:allophanate hydrolase subunit 1
MTSDSAESRCEGCGLVMPAGTPIAYDGYFNASAECWSVFTEVIGREFSNAVLFGQVHHLTVEAYVVQHPGGLHPDKSIDIHLAGLYLMMECGVAPAAVAPYMQKLADRIRDWPHLHPPPSDRWPMTIFDVALADDHIAAVREWSASVWEAWTPQRDRIAALLDENAINTRGSLE